ncbi:MULTISPECIES: DMT family transporter [Haloprofundus]|uniref:DMT family transporter n=1 Tax=Haloprofundus TaxID=1911573 RepID=UPI000E44127E|nr:MULTISPECIES: EamA family transporter [Haloprofundus]QCJ46566.1 EamA/RhaT family transporter [Haloprofundus sp. MHR1]
MSRYRDVGLFFLLSALWGGSFVAIEVGLENLPPVLFAALRFDVAAVLLLGYAASRLDDPIPRTRGDVAAIAASAFLIVAANNALLFVGQTQTTGSIASIVYSLNPILTTAFAALLVGGVGLDSRGYVGVLLGLVGVVVVAGPDPSLLSGDLSGDALGVAIVFCAAVAVSLGSVLVRRADAQTPSVAVTAWSMALGAIVIHTGSLAAEGVPPVSFTPRTVLALLFLGVFASALAYSIYFDLLDRQGPFQANLVAYVVPVVATFLGWSLLNEQITAMTVGGFLLVFVGFALVKYETLTAELPKLRASLRSVVGLFR